jgi:predicted transcriptional regulator
VKRREPLPRKTFFDLPPLELECMKALWAQGEASVKEIRAHINGMNGRGLAYTTIETIMDRLTRKGAVTRRKIGRAHVYTAQYQAAAARADAVSALVHHFFGGSRRALASYLAGEPLPEPATKPEARLPRVPQGGTRGQPNVDRPLSTVAFAKEDAAAKKPKPQTQPPQRPFDPSLL